MLEKVEKVLEEEVRPQLMRHEGDVKVVELEHNILKVKLLGKCSGCPSATLTTEEFIGDAIRRNIPQIQDVVLVNEVHPELIDMAKKILSH